VEVGGGALLMQYAFLQVQFQEYVKIHKLCGQHSIIYPIPIIIFNKLNAECEIEWSIFHWDGAVFENILFTVGLNTIIFIEKQLRISVVHDHHWAINTVF